MRMTPRQNLWDMIVIVIALNFLHKDFDIITVSLLETRDKQLTRFKASFNLKKSKTSVNKSLEKVSATSQWYSGITTCQKKRPITIESDIIIIS